MHTPLPPHLPHSLSSLSLSLVAEWLRTSSLSADLCVAVASRSIISETSAVYRPGCRVALISSLPFSHLIRGRGERGVIFIHDRLRIPMRTVHFATHAPTSSVYRRADDIIDGARLFLLIAAAVCWILKPTSWIIGCRIIIINIIIIIQQFTDCFTKQ